MIDPTVLPALLSLLTVARTGSVGATAREHHRTSSAISQQIRRLEGHLGVKLLERAGRGVRLTHAGEAALPAIGALRGEMEALLARLAELSTRPVSTLRVAASDYLGKTLLAPVLRRLLDERVPVRFEIITTHSRDAIGRVARGLVEFGVVSGGSVPTGLDAQALFDQGFAWVGPRRPRGRRDPLLARLSREPLLRLAAESHGRRLLDELLERERLRPASIIDVTSVSLMLAYIGSGIGVGLVPILALGDVARARVVVEPADVPATPVTLVSRPTVRRNPAAVRFAVQLGIEGQRAASRLTRFAPRPARTSRPS
jgi:DNA-binding transcriptional LysR family regulator